MAITHRTVKGKNVLLVLVVVLSQQICWCTIFAGWCIYKLKLAWSNLFYLWRRKKDWPFPISCLFYWNMSKFSYWERLLLMLDEATVCASSCIMLSTREFWRVCGFSQWVFRELNVFYAIFISCGITLIPPLGRFGFSAVFNRQGNLLHNPFVRVVYFYIPVVLLLLQGSYLFCLHFQKRLISWDLPGWFWFWTHFFSYLRTVTHKHKNNVHQAYVPDIF